MAIPEDIKPIWDLMYDETVAVHAYSILFEQLFGGSQDQLDLLSRSAGFCFSVIQDALATDVQLSLSKLSDPAESKGKTNATTQHLLNEVRALGWPAPVDELQRLWQSFTDSCEPIRLSRNKMIAHLDRATALQTGRVIPPVMATVGDVKKALQALRTFMNAVEAYLGEAPTAYEHFLMRGEGGDNLVSLLRMAERYQVLQSEQKISWDDPQDN